MGVQNVSFKEPYATGSDVDHGVSVRQGGVNIRV